MSKGKADQKLFPKSTTLEPLMSDWCDSSCRLKHSLHVAEIEPVNVTVAHVQSLKCPQSLSLPECLYSSPISIGFAVICYSIRLLHLFHSSPSSTVDLLMTRLRRSTLAAVRQQSPSRSCQERTRAVHRFLTLQRAPFPELHS